MAAYLRKYATGTGADIYIPVIKRGAVDFAVSADWTPATGDVTLSKDGAAAGNITTLPTAITMGNGAMWKFVFSDTELTCKKLSVSVVDSATKAVEDQFVSIETYGNASAMHVFDFSSATVTAGTVSDKTGYALSSSGLDSISTTAPSGVASNFREMMIAVWRRWHKKTTLTATQLKSYADDGSTVLTTQTVSDDGTTQTVGASA